MKKITGAFVLFFAKAVIGQTPGIVNLSEYTLYDDQQRPMYVRLKEDYRVNERQAREFITAALFGESNNRLEVKTVEKDELGFTHTRYSVIQNNAQVAGKMIITHTKAGKLVSVNGDLYSIPAPVNSFQLSESAALQAALAKVNAEVYMWEDKANEEQMRDKLNDPSFTYQPQGKKVLYEKEGSFISAYCFNIYAQTPLYRSNVYVNASTGAILEEQNLLCTVDVPGTALTKYSGTQTIVCNQTASYHELKESTRGLGVETLNMNNTTAYPGSTSFTNSSAAFTATNNNQAATDAHWGAEKTYDYYFYQHNRNSINNAGFKLLSYVHYGNNYTNAFWDGQRMTYGDGNGGSMRIFTALDVCGHEITHGLTDLTANLVYSNESGALNESFSDIFGACIENYARPTNWNWKVGEDITSNNNGLRSMANPNAYGDPDTYGGTNWYVGTADNGGVHTNSGVGNYWFYLLTIGGAGTNDLANTYSVQGLGFTNAARIAFRALTVYFTANTNYANARALSIQAAIDLFGSCSNEMAQTMNAWHAVGVGAKYVPNVLAPNFTADNLTFCTLPATVSFNNTTPFGFSYQWNFGDGSALATSTNVVHTYTAAGSYNVKLKVGGCNNVTDSITKSSYITISIPPSPVLASITACQNQPVVLNATAPDVIKWYDNSTGTNVIGTGSSFTTPPLNSNTTYYVANTLPSTPAVGGILSNVGGSYLNNAQQYLIFNVTAQSTLNSVVMYAQNGGNTTIELRNSANQLVNTVTVALAQGANTVVLFFPMAVGNNYRLNIVGGLNLYRSNSGVTYPYNIGGCVNITNSSAGAGYYYYFYKWTVTKADCSSPLIPVNITLNPVPSVSLALNAVDVCKDDAVILTGSPAGGVYSGQGVSGSMFNGSVLAAGMQTVTYTYTDANGCSNTDSKLVFTNECTGIRNHSGGALINVYPNPAKNKLQIEGLVEGSVITVSDVAGRELASFKANSGNENLDLSNWSKGLYMLNISYSGQQIKTLKVIKE